MAAEVEEFISSNGMLVLSQAKQITNDNIDNALNKKIVMDYLVRIAALVLIIVHIS